MNRLAVWVARTAVGATVPMALARATTSPLSEADDRLDPDIAAPPLVAMNVSLGLEGMARGAAIQRAKVQRAKVQRAKVQRTKVQRTKVQRTKVQRTKSASASNSLTAHPVTAANDSRIHDTNGSVPMPTCVWHR
jgi:hypothetical protein